MGGILSKVGDKKRNYCKVQREGAGEKDARRVGEQHSDVLIRRKDFYNLGHLIEVAVPRSLSQTQKNLQPTVKSQNVIS